MGGGGAPTSAALVSGVAEVLLEREALISSLRTSGEREREPERPVTVGMSVASWSRGPPLAGLF